MNKYFFLFWINLLISFHSLAQVDSLSKLRIGLKITPLQFIFGEKAATVELKFLRLYSAELKAGVFGQNTFKESFYWSEEKVVASGYLTQIGLKRYLNSKKGYQNQDQPWKYRKSYLQLLGLYKQSSFDKRTLILGPSSWDLRTVQAQAIDTYGLKGQFGYEFLLANIVYVEIYAGLGWRIRNVRQIIYEEYPDFRRNYPFYPIEAKKKQAYFTPQLGFNVGVELPFRRKVKEINKKT